ncbi:uncharacterized protein DFL_003657 [Arthrobotrys flagrans]|uniref:Uncharacterized protein n=1 Tax=Arthrobotrys flagrans TaxID=97331 RepID=A0A437A2H3_ARTFL|nr:hypothetical protein DFL_003657 [Arthrobotrys flagrans]
MPSQPQSPRPTKGAAANGRIKASSESTLLPLAEEQKAVNLLNNGGGNSGRWVMKPVEYDPDGYGDQFAFEVVIRK